MPRRTAWGIFTHRSAEQFL